MGRVIGRPSNPFGAAIDSSEITDGTIAAGDLAAGVVRALIVGGINRVAANGFPSGTFVPALWVLDGSAGTTSHAAYLSAAAPVHMACTLQNIRAIVGPGTQDAGTQTWTLYRNGTATAITFDIVNTDAAGLEVVVAGTLAIVAEDTLAWHMSNSGASNDDRGCVIVGELAYT